MEGDDTQAIRSASPEIRAALERMLRDEPDLRLAILYGSAASGRLRADSDVDLAVLYRSPMTAEARRMMSERLERALHRRVDLVDLAVLHGTILKQVLCRGCVLVKRSPEDLAALVRRMVYNQADMMPYVRRTLLERQRRFMHGP